ncbi:UNVERIFIED_CONTAM: hypothetical protein GTU68_023697 [Idotea baltica]|nr:hypothetical protein [Idotea baltica]
MKSTLQKTAESLGLIGVLVVVAVIFGIADASFLSTGTFNSIANSVPALAVVAVGMTFVIMTGGIDLSVGSVLAFGGSMLGIAMVDWGWPFAPAILIAVAIGALCGAGNGFVSVKFGVPSFIVTLGMMQIARGLAQRTTDSQTKYIGAEIEWLSAPIATIGVSPAFIGAVLVVVLGQILLSKTVFGRYAKVIGANEEAAVFSGISTNPIKIAVFVIAGALAGLGAAFDASRFASANPGAGNMLELDAIAAVVIGGTSLMGGRGSVVGTFLGVLIMATLAAGLGHIGAENSTKLVVTGVVIVIAVIIDAWRIRRMKLKKSS